MPTAEGTDHPAAAGRKIVAARLNGKVAGHALLKLGLVTEVFQEMEFKKAQDKLLVAGLA
ncbi:MAG: hypothetical protein A2Y91_04650 [Chloroflexi bacterium RBG_13_54_8]|nr:MAG: hypothetical protein A2Y91_04650 [Chloroflexi bacterium RBG_13_54_8]